MFAQNYLLFGHILKCSVIPKAQVHKDLFKGSNKRFKVRRISQGPIATLTDIDS